MTEISQKALDRKKKFLESKNSGELIVKPNAAPVLDRDWHLYYTNDGTIVCWTQEDVKPSDDWQTFDFTQKELKDLIGKDLNKYWVRPSDPPELHLKPLKTVELDTYREITSKKGKAFDISFEITSTSLIIKMNKKTKKQFAGMYPISASKNGYRLLKFYIAENIDPYFVYAEITVPLAELITEDAFEYPLLVNLSAYAVYGLPIFEKNVRIA